MDAGELDRRVTIQRQTETDDGLATVPGSWADLVTVWAKLMPVSGQEKLAAAQNSSFSLRRFKIRKPSIVLTTKDRLVFEDDGHDIADIRQDGRAFLVLECNVRGDG
jgi:SPP1 family predicted phage head-tail adaptor